MLPWWKLGREMRRFKGQVSALSDAIRDRFFSRTWNDIVLRSKRRLLPGAQPDGPRRAIYLIFPRDGLLESHRHTLAYLAGKGLSITVVSNLPLPPEDEAELLTLCHRYLERPNFGYDFGGYRDGVRLMAADLAQTKQLVLMNDSVWFPVTDTDWLDQVDALDVDFAGTVSQHGLPRVDAAAFRDLQVTYTTDHPRFHYGSFALAIGPRILRDPSFLRYWRKLRLSERKRKTVTFGEVGLTAWVLANGYSHGDTLGVATLADRLSDLDEATLREGAARLLMFADKQMSALREDPDFRLEDLDRDAVLRLIMTATARTGPGYIPAWLTVLQFGHPFLKKAPARRSARNAEITADILRTLDTPAARAALKELDAMR